MLNIKENDLLEQLKFVYYIWGCSHVLITSAQLIEKLEQINVFPYEYIASLIININ